MGVLSARQTRATVPLSNLPERTEWVDDSVLDIVGASTGTGAATSIHFARARCLRTHDNLYILEFIVNMTTTSGTAGRIAFTGCDLNGGNFERAIVGSTVGAANVRRTYREEAQNRIVCEIDAGVATRYGFEGTIDLAGKPSWFDANREAGFSITAQVDSGTPSVTGLAYAPRVQRKERTTNVGSTGIISELTFNNLIVGNWYKSSGVIQISGTSAASTTHIELQTSAGSQIARLAFDGGTSGQHWNGSAWSFPFKATNSQARINVLALNATELTANGGASLFHTMEDLPNHVETTDWN